MSEHPTYLPRAARIEVVRQDDDHVWLVVYLQDRDYYWYSLKLKIPKKRLDPM